MMTGDAKAVFLDTNILVYANVSESSFHELALEAIQSLYNAGIELWTSRQVLREFLMTLTRPQAFMNPRPVATVIERVRFFQTQFQVVEDGPHVTEKLLTLMNVTQPDIQASNGVIYAVDQILLTPEVRRTLTSKLSAQ